MESKMLLSRQELHFDFGGSGFDFSRPEEKDLLAWVFNQFLYGEVTGIQCGHWLYHAPSISAASFLAKQAGEEFSHVRKFLRILSLLERKPEAAHWAVRSMATGMMGGNWGEHVAIEMALGEGLVLTVFHAMVETSRGHAEIHKILETSAVEEERHVEFGERETKDWLAKHPWDRERLLAQAFLQLWLMRRVRGFVLKQLTGKVRADHPVLSRFPDFYEHVVACFETRIERLGLSDRPIRQLSGLYKLGLLLRMPYWAIKGKLSARAPLLTKTYLTDPALEAESRRYSRPAVS